MTATDPVAVLAPPHAHAPEHVARMMRRVLLALVPGVAVQVWVFGAGVIIHILLALVAALAAEASMLRARRLPLRPAVTDGSVCITAVLFAVAMSPVAAWWLTVIGVLFAVIVAKHAYGGLGCNIFNPAMAGYAFVLLCFPAAMQPWPVDATAPAQALAHIFAGADAAVDAMSGATALESLRTELRGMKMLSELVTPPGLRQFASRGSAWINAAYLLGGIWLLAVGVIRWQIPVGFLGSLALLALVFHLGDADRYLTPLLHLCNGATMIGAFFIATDPVSSPVAPMGRLVFGVATGVLVYLIRTFGAWPDGVAFAVLLMNAAVPLIDRYTRPRVLGEQLR